MKKNIIGIDDLDWSLSTTCLETMTKNESRKNDDEMEMMIMERTILSTMQIMT